MKEPLGDKARLEHIRDAVRLILKFVEGATFEDFMKNEMMFSACLMQLGIIGEASTNLTAQIRERHPEVDWKSMIGMRIILIHKYFGVHEKVIWDTIEQDLPTLKTQIETILKELE